MRELKDKVAVVTGAASGIGRATAVLLANEGCHVAVSDINEQGLKETADMIKKTGRNVSTHLIDTSHKESMAQFPEEVVTKHGRVHLVINNAGVAVADTFNEGRLEDFEWLMGINFWGMVYGTKFFLPYLLKEDEAHIVNVSSIFGFIGVPGNVYYCSSKFAIRGFTEALWGELADTNVNISTVHPGGIDTQIAVNARFRRSLDGSTREDLIDGFKQMARTSPEKAASIIVNGIKKNKKRIRVGLDAIAIDWMARIFPSGYPKLLNMFFSRANKKKD